MQWIEKVIKFFAIFFRSNAFKNKYRTKKVKQLRKILNNPNWQVVDVRNSISYGEHHFKGTVNIPNTEFIRRYYKSIDQSKKILLINENFRSNLDLYHALKKHSLKPYILYANYSDIRNDEQFDDITKLEVFL
jgi:rhodanese-related sulfurtransferase